MCYVARFLLLRHWLLVTFYFDADKYPTVLLNLNVESRNSDNNSVAAKNKLTELAGKKA